MMAFGIGSRTVKLSRKLTKVLEKIDNLNHEYSRAVSNRETSRYGWGPANKIAEKLRGYDQAAKILADLLPY